MTRLWERSCVVLSALTLACALVLLAQFQGLLPWSEQPIRLNTSSELSGEMSVFINTENSMTLTNVATNKNGAKMTITTRVQDYPTVDDAWTAHFDAIKRWQADETIQP